MKTKILLLSLLLASAGAHATAGANHGMDARAMMTAGPTRSDPHTHACDVLAGIGYTATDMRDSDADADEIKAYAMGRLRKESNAVKNAGLHIIDKIMRSPEIEPEEVQELVFRDCITQPTLK